MSNLKDILAGPYFYAENTKRVASQYAELTSDEQQRLLCFALEALARQNPCDTCIELREAYDQIEEANSLLCDICEALVVEKDPKKEDTGALILQQVREILLQVEDAGLRDRLLRKAALQDDTSFEVPVFHFEATKP